MYKLEASRSARRRDTDPGCRPTYSPHLIVFVPASNLTPILAHTAHSYPVQTVFQHVLIIVEDALGLVVGGLRRLPQPTNHQLLFLITGELLSYVNRPCLPFQPPGYPFILEILGINPGTRKVSFTQMVKAGEIRHLRPGVQHHLIFALQRLRSGFHEIPRTDPGLSHLDLTWNRGFTPELAGSLAQV